jgi:hypothetical protein
MTTLTKYLKGLSLTAVAAVALAAAPSAKANIIFDWVSTGGTSATGEVVFDNTLTSFISGSFTPSGLSTAPGTIAFTDSSGIFAGFYNLPSGEEVIASSLGKTGSYDATLVTGASVTGTGYWSQEVPDATATASLLGVSFLGLSFVSRRFKRSA